MVDWIIYIPPVLLTLLGLGYQYFSKTGIKPIRFVISQVAILGVSVLTYNVWLTSITSSMYYWGTISLLLSLGYVSVITYEKLSSILKAQKISVTKVLAGIFIIFGILSIVWVNNITIFKILMLGSVVMVLLFLLSPQILNSRATFITILYILPVVFLILFSSNMVKEVVDNAWGVSYFHLINLQIKILTVAVGEVFIIMLYVLASIGLYVDNYITDILPRIKIYKGSGMVLSKGVFTKVRID